MLGLDGGRLSMRGLWVAATGDMQMDASDLSHASVSRVAVDLPTKASVFPVAVWSFRVESWGLRADGGGAAVTRTLEDVACARPRGNSWPRRASGGRPCKCAVVGLRRALLYAVPGVVARGGAALAARARELTVECLDQEIIQWGIESAAGPRRSRLRKEWSTIGGRRFLDQTSHRSIWSKVRNW